MLIRRDRPATMQQGSKIDSMIRTDKVNNWLVQIFFLKGRHQNRFQRPNNNWIEFAGHVYKIVQTTGSVHSMWKILLWNMNSDPRTSNFELRAMSYKHSWASLNQNLTALNVNRQHLFNNGPLTLWLEYDLIKFLWQDLQQLLQKRFQKPAHSLSGPVG
jgi:hypothetical protein